MQDTMRPNFIFITGGVVSSLGKGIATAAIGALLQSSGYRVKIRKLDPYLNVDPGTMNPNQHGEVFVTDDGAETDLDLGHYERFLGVNTQKSDSITAGKIYKTLIENERRGEYLGNTVQVIPHVTDIIKQFILFDKENYDFILCEIGGTVGDIEGLPFFEAIRQLKLDLDPQSVLYIHLTLVPYLTTSKELKTKPTQHSVKQLCALGIQPNILLCRTEGAIPADDIKKIASFCNLHESNVIPLINVDTIYEVPLELEKYNITSVILDTLGIPKKQSTDTEIWQSIITQNKSIARNITIGLVGKYIKLEDAYKSIIESLLHAGMHNGVKVNIKWIDARNITKQNIAHEMHDVYGIIVPGGFGTDGTEGKIIAIQYARENNIPFFGICFGMQLAVIEACRNLLQMPNASSSEFSNDINSLNVVSLLTEWNNNGVIETRSTNSAIGGTMRLGKYKCIITPGSMAERIYGATEIEERHRHRYEINPKYLQMLERHGIVMSGVCASTAINLVLPEIIEHKNHKWFLAVQFHPEFKSMPFRPHKLFCDFIKSIVN